MTGFTKAQTGVAGTATGGTTVQATLGSNPATGDTVCVGVFFFDATTTPATMTVQDGNGNNYTVESHTHTSDMDKTGQALQAYLVNAPANADKVITVTFSKANIVAAVWVDDFTVTGGTSAYDSGAASAAAAAGAIITPTIPVSGSSELLYCVVCDEDDVSSAVAPWTANDGGNQFGCGAGLILSASVNTAVTWVGTVGRLYGSIGMSFSFTPSGGDTLFAQSVM